MSIHILGIGEVSRDDSFDLKNFPVAPKTYLDRGSALALASASLALQSAELSGPLGDDFGLITVTTHGCVETMRAFEATLHDKGSKGASPLLFSHSYFNSPAAILAIEWGISGYHAPLVGEDFEVAVDLARDILALRYVSRVLVGGFEVQSLIGALSGEIERERAVFFVLEKGEDINDYEFAREKIKGSF